MLKKYNSMRPAIIFVLLGILLAKAMLPVFADNAEAWEYPGTNYGGVPHGDDGYTNRSVTNAAISHGTYTFNFPYGEGDAGYNTAIGFFATVGDRDDASVQTLNSVALGAESNVTRSYTVSIGSTGYTYNRSSTGTEMVTVEPFQRYLTNVATIGDIAEVLSDESFTASDGVNYRYDAVNVETLKKALDGYNAGPGSGGWNLKVGDADSQQIAAGDTVTLKSGDDGNITITPDAADGKAITFALSPTPNFTSVTIGGKVQISESGVNMAGTSITNLASPVNDGDAANKGYVDTSVDSVVNSVNSLNNLAVQYTSEAKTEVALANNDGNGTKLTNVANGENALDAVNVSQLDEVRTEAQRKGAWNLKVNNDSPSIIENGGSVTISDGSNIEIRPDGSGGYTFNVVSNPNFGNVTANSITAGAISANADGIDMGEAKITNLGDPVLERDATNKKYVDSAVSGVSGEVSTLSELVVKYDDSGKKTISLENINSTGTKLTNVANGENDLDAVNVSQLNAVKAAAEDKGSWNLKVNSYDPVSVGNGGTVGIANGRNVEIEKNADGAYVFNVSASPTFDSIGAGTITASTSVSVGGKLSLSASGIDMNNTRIENLGTPVNENDAVNKGFLTEYVGEQIDSLGDAVAASALAVTYENETRKTVSLGGEGGTTITNVAAGVNDLDAVNVSQLNAVKAAAEDKGSWNLKVNSYDPVSVGNGGTVGIANGRNVEIEKNADGAYVFNVSASPTFDSIGAGTITASTSVSVGGKLSLSASGIDMDGASITNLQTPNGAYDAANKQYVDNAFSDVTTKVDSLNNLSVLYSDDTKTSVSLEYNNGAGTELSNVAAGRNALDAVNYSQLSAVSADIAETSAIVTELQNISELSVRYDSARKDIVTLGDGAQNVIVRNVATPVGDYDAANKKYVDDSIGDMSAAIGGLDKYAIRYHETENAAVLDHPDHDGAVRVSNVARGTDELDAVNFGQLNEVIGNVGDVQNDIIDIKQNVTDIDNRLVSVEGDVYDIKNNIANLEGAVESAVTYDDDSKSQVTLNKGGDAVALTNVKDGAIADGSKDAVTGGQMYSLGTSISSILGDNVSYDGDSFSVTEGFGGKAQNLTLNDAIGDIYETMESIKQTSQEGSWIFQANDSPADEISHGQKLRLVDGANGNLNIRQETDGSYSFNVSDNPRFNSVRVGNVDINSSGINMANTRISNLAPGRIARGSSDAVTGDQLWNAYQRIDHLNEDIHVVGAHAAALSALHPVPYNPYEPTTLSAGIGTYRDEYSVAVGVFHYVRENLMFNIGASLASDGDVMGRAGVSFAIGKSIKKKPELARDMVGMQRQMMAMQAMIIELQERNERNEETIKKLTLRLEENDN